ARRVPWRQRLTDRCQCQRHGGQLCRARRATDFLYEIPRSGLSANAADYRHCRRLCSSGILQRMKMILMALSLLALAACREEGLATPTSATGIDRLSISTPGGRRDFAVELA